MRSEMKTTVPTVPAIVASSVGSPGAAAPRPAHPPVKRMDVIKQTLLLFIHSKWIMCPDHRFAFTSCQQPGTAAAAGRATGQGDGREAGGAREEG
ncbi:hypothetical protein GUJ93_ZPchr0236g16429 [Zizania palustris]|uniref:Uncharacterized protein n=1 Tax=Zizania palustris TaxID=103762 RepID=A0A8J5REA8_ZIZPA|nr:hypothetical protein GUJ93_ZPchr0236g16429 [Zizania palustris]